MTSKNGGFKESWGRLITNFEDVGSTGWSCQVRASCAEDLFDVSIVLDSKTIVTGCCNGSHIFPQRCLSILNF